MTILADPAPTAKPFVGSSIALADGKEGPYQRRIPVAADIPASLRNIDRWVCAAFEPKPGKPGKFEKVPIDAKNGRKASSANFATWSPFSRAVAYLEKHTSVHGVGFVLGAGGVVGIDIDHCRDNDTGVIEPWAQRIIDRFDSYTEISPGLAGVRIFVRGRLPDKSPKTNSRGFEWYEKGRFLTVTGNVLQGGEVRDASAEAFELTRAEMWPAMSATSSKPAPATSSKPAPVSGDFDRAVTLAAVTDETMVDLRAVLLQLSADNRDEWIDVGHALKATGRDDAFDLWDKWSSKSYKYNVEEMPRLWNGFNPLTITHKSIFDLTDKHGIPNPKSKGSEKAAPAARTPGLRPFQSSTAEEFIARTPSRRFWIRDVLPAEPLVFVFGASGAGKSFAVIDLCMAIARGIQWRGKHVEKGRIVYVCAEGQGGFGRRLLAYKLHHGLDRLPDSFVVISDAPNLLNASDVDEIGHEIEFVVAGGADLIVVDTLARAMPGANENSGEDVGTALKHCAALHRRFGATVVLVTHTGKDETKGVRGWSGQKGAADAQLWIKRIGDARVVEVEKMKDGREGALFGFKVTPVPIGVDDDGSVIESAVVEHVDEVPARKISGLGFIQKLVLEAIKEGVGLAGSVDEETVTATAFERMQPPKSGRDKRKTRIGDALDSLVRSGWIEAGQGRISLVS